MKFTLKNLAIIVAFLSSSSVCAPSHAEEKGRIETSLLGLFPLNNSIYNTFDNNYLVRGKIYDNALVQDIYEFGNSTTYETGKEYDVFEADIAAKCTSSLDQLRFFVLGDGDIIYRSRRLTNNDKPIHISIPVKKYRGVTLVTQTYFTGGLTQAVWADPKLVRFGNDLSLAPRLPQPATPVAPSTNSRDRVTLSRPSEGAYDVTVNGKPVSFGDAQPVLKDGALLVPIRPLFEALGAKVTFSDDDKLIIATRGKRQVILQLDSTSAYIDGQLKPLDVPVQSSNGTTLVPLRFLAEAFGAKIDYAGATETGTSSSTPLP